MISVLMAVKNGWQYFPEALASLEAQEHVEWELTIGVNGDSPGYEALNRIDKHIPAGAENVFLLDLRHITSNKPQALNAMVSGTEGSHIAILDVDDVWHPWKLAQQVAYVRDYDVVGTMGEYFGTTSGPIPIPSGPISFDALLEKNCLLHSSVVMKREHAHWPDTEGLDDYPLWLELAFQGKRLMNVGGEPLVKIRCHPEQHYPTRDNSDAIRKRYRARQFS